MITTLYSLCVVLFELSDKQIFILVEEKTAVIFFTRSGTFEPLHTECRKPNEWLRSTEVVSRLLYLEAFSLATTINNKRLAGTTDW